MTRLTLVRHGETEGQSSIRYHGRTDVPLSAAGRAQMLRVRGALAGPFAAVYASRLCRSTEAATIVGRTTAVMHVPGFDEIDFGAWEGLTAEEIQHRDPVLHAQWAATPDAFTYPGGESTAAFRARVASAARAVLAAAPPGELLCVVHKGVIRSILAELLQLDDQQRRAVVAELGSIHVVSLDAGRWHAVTLDRTDHLGVEFRRPG